MKREELTALGLSDEVLDRVMALYGRDIEKHKTAARTWEEQYTADTAALKAQLALQSYHFATERAADTLRFSSGSAKQAFCGALQEAALPLEGDELTGFAEFAAAYRAKDPAAFAETPPQDAPVLLRPTGGSALGVADSALRAAFGLNRT